MAPGTRLAMRAVDTAELRSGGGIVGDRYENARHRHVSLQSTEDLAASSAALGTTIDPGSTRRNITVSGPPLPTTPGVRITIGSRIADADADADDGRNDNDNGNGVGAVVELEVVRVAAPCKIMDDAVGPGAHRAMRHRGGVICRVIAGGVVAVGDPVTPAR
ncbi:MAG: MOSC domain-containing protein [Acidimicrobiales bacterium]